MADEFPHVLFVQGEWDPNTPKLKNKLTIYFQSKKSNGGDCCVKLLGGQRATVAFKSEEVRQNVLKRKPHKIKLGKNVINLNVHLSPEEASAAQESQSPIPEQQPALSRQENQPTSAEPQSEKSEKQEPTEESEGGRSAVLENIQNMNQEILVMLVENVLRDAPESKKFSIEVIPESNCAVVTFTSRKCAENFILFCPSHSIFKKNSLAVRPLEMTTKVKAEDLPLNLNSDYIFLYFEKFGEIKGDIKMLKDGPSAIITFQDHTAVNNVLGKQHQIKQQPLKVFPYYDSLETALYGKDRPMLRLPEIFTENIDISIGKYLQENREKLDLIKQEMCKHYCQLDLQASSMKIIPLASLLQQGSQTRKLIQAWREKASAEFVAEMSKYKSLEINILRDAWSEAVEEIQKTLCAEPVTLVLQENQATVILAGLAEDVSRTRDAVNRATDSITQRIQREKGSITDEVSMAYSIYEIVRLGGVELEIQSKFPEMELNYHSHSQKLVLYGLKQEVLESKIRILQKILSLNRRVVELHPSILEFLTKRDKEDLTNDLFLSRGIIASLEIKDNVASLIAKTEKTLKDGEEHLKTVLIYKCLDVEDPRVTRKAEWQDLITSLNSSFNSPVKVVLINTSGNQVTVSGFADALELVLEQLTDFLEANSSITTSLEADGIVIRFIEEHRKQDWFEMVKNKVNVDFKDDKISLNGPRVHISQCTPVFEDLLSTVYQGNLKVAKPGARKFFKKKETMYISEAKNNTGCLVELVDENESGGASGKKGVFTPERAEIVVNKYRQGTVQQQHSKGDQQQVAKDFAIDGKVLNPACFSICGPSRAAVDQAKQWIEKLISDEQAFESISDPMILNLSDKDQQRIQELQKSMDVSVRVEHKTHGAGSDDTTILVEGLSRDVLMAVSEIQTMLRKARDDFSLKKDMEFASEMVEWQYEQGGQYHSFDQLTNFKLEQALTLKSPHVDITVQGQAYKVTMPEGPAVSAVGGNQMNIKRIDKLQDTEACETTPCTDIRYTKQLSGNMKISVWKDDLTTHKVDAVVNSANEQLNHGGGLALALSLAGGPEIQQMCDHFIQTNKRVHTGDAIVTTAGKLPCKMIIHAVGPSVPYNPSAKDVSNAKPFLESVIWKILTLAQYNNLQSVAIPAISSGLYNFPRHICADIIVNTVKSFSDKQHPQSTSLEVRLVNNDDPSVREMLRACQQFLGPSATQSGAIQSQSVSSATSTHSNQGNVTFFFKKGEIQEQTTQTPVKQHHAPKIWYTKQLSGGMKISVWKDALTTHKVDAVVNTANEQLQHGGGLALALSRAGGPEIQQMCDHYIQTNGRVHTGDAIMTSAGNLPCKMIIHAVGPSVPKNPSAKDVSAAKPFLESVIWKILTLAQYNNLQSVAIPAISSGLYNFPRHICADIIVNTVKSFSDKQHPQSTSLEVRLVNNDDPSVREMLRACQQLLGPSGTMQKQTIVSTKSA